MPIPSPIELILLLVIILIVFGPGKLPDIGNAVGKGIREFRKASSDLQDAADLSPRPPASPSPPPTATAQLHESSEAQDSVQADVPPRGTPSDPKGHAS